MALIHKHKCGCQVAIQTTPRGRITAVVEECEQITRESIKYFDHVYEEARVNQLTGDYKVEFIKWALETWEEYVWKIHFNGRCGRKSARSKGSRVSSVIIPAVEDTL